MECRGMELRWLRRYDRHLVVPEVVFVDGLKTEWGQECGGYYAPPEKRIFDIGGHEVDGRFGVIAVNSSEAGSIPATLAHEWRHHWQWHRGIEFDHVAYDVSDYEASIGNYFRSSRTEMDALLFEHKVARGWVNEYFMELAHRTPKT